MLSLDEAIKHAEAVADANERLCEIVHSAVQLSNYGKCAKEHRQLAQWMKELKSLKGKEEPRAVHYEGDGYADGKMVYDMAYCPCCNHYFEEDSENWECDFCPNCGQRLRWEE